MPPSHVCVCVLGACSDQVLMLERALVDSCVGWQLYMHPRMWVCGGTLRVCVRGWWGLLGYRCQGVGRWMQLLEGRITTLSRLCTFLGAAALRVPQGADQNFS